jgi:hypothetical protein
MPNIILNISELTPSNESHGAVPNRDTVSKVAGLYKGKFRDILNAGTEATFPLEMEEHVESGPESNCSSQRPHPALGVSAMTAGARRQFLGAIRKTPQLEMQLAAVPDRIPLEMEMSPCERRRRGEICEQGKE